MNVDALIHDIIHKLADIRKILKDVCTLNEDILDKIDDLGQLLAQAMVERKESNDV